jgi:alkylation response protein AidB-like acyl-CoA dehydrogenase
MADAGTLPHVVRALHGHVAASNALSPRVALGKLSPFVRPLVRYEPDDPWERDTRALPAPLANYRRRLRRFAERHLAPRALSADLEPHPPLGTSSEANLELLRAAGCEGLLSDLLPRPLGSMPPRLLRYPLFLAQALKTEELAAVDGGLMLLICAHDLGVAPVLLSGEMRAIRRYLLPAFRTSEAGEPHLFAFAITEPAAGSDVEDGHGARLHRPGVVARRTPGGYRIRGRKCFISGGDLAASVVVFAALEGEGMESWTAFVVPRGAPGFRVARTELKMGMRASGAAELELDDVPVSECAVVGGLRGGWGLNRATLNMSRIPVAAMAVGFARAATEEATRFACGFRLGGKPIVEFQEVQVALAQMMAETTAARSMVWQVATRRQARQGEASAAKFYCTDAARRVCELAMDLMSNHAVLHDNRVEKAFRDARLTQIFEGTNQINRLSVIEDEQERLLDAVEHARAGANGEDDEHAAR